MLEPSIIEVLQNKEARGKRLLRVLPKISEKVVIYSVWPCGAEQNFAHGVFFRLAYTTTHQCVQNIKTLFKGNPRVEHQSMY